MESCARNDIDETSYEQAHVCRSCQCEKLLPDLERIMQILRENEIPVVCLEILDGEPRLAVSARSKTSPGDYIAISHVWADGLGGSTEIGLNLCQVERVSRLCSSLRRAPTTIYFWIDCLCIPRSDRDVYFQALIGIRDVYINASLVLVIDKTIEQCTSLSSTEYLYAHIYLSAWMQRMWTYEEAVLAKELVFALKDGFHKYKVNTFPSMRQTVCVVWQSLAAQLYRLRIDQMNLNIGHIHRAFRYRLTNARQEEFLSVSGMLRLDTQSLLEVKGEDRTKMFWLMLRWIPFNVLFLDCPRMSERGFRWAPKTMMSPSQTTMDTEVQGERSECTQEGLIGHYLMVNFDNVLKGSAGESGSIFYVWVKGSDSSNTSTGDSLALLRVYCVQSWPTPPKSHSFDTIMLPSEAKTILSAGQWTAGAAFFRQLRVNKDPQTSKLSTNILDKFLYVGRLLIERLQNHELGSSTRTIMFPGSSRVNIDTEGIWSVKKICIT